MIPPPPEQTLDEKSPQRVRGRGMDLLEIGEPKDSIFMIQHFCIHMNRFASF